MLHQIEKVILIMSVYRHKFNPVVTALLADFAKLNSGKKLSDFKLEWSKFLIVNKREIDIEVVRLNACGMEGDVIHKLFSSARYWHDKKKRNITKPKENSVMMSKEFLNAIDTHIKNNSDYKPSVAFTDFCGTNMSVLKLEIQYLKSESFTVDEIRVKIKKTYKNRYFSYDLKSKGQ